MLYVSRHFHHNIYVANMDHFRNNIHGFLGCSTTYLAQIYEYGLVRQGAFLDVIEKKKKISVFTFSKKRHKYIICI